MVDQVWVKIWICLKGFELCPLLTDGTLLIGASSLAGRSWQGSVWIYSEPEHAPNEAFCKAGVQTEAGITDVKWVADKRIVVTSDSGEVYRLTKSE